MIVVVQPCHVGAYLLLITLILEAADRQLVTKEIIMETVVYLAISLQHKLGTNLSIAPNSKAAKAHEKHHTREHNQAVLDVILSITIKIINICKEIEGSRTSPTVPEKWLVRP